MNLFKVVKLEGDWWGVFIINPKDEKDRYLVTSTFDKLKDAEHFASEFNRIAA
jgi:hypothetical protein